MGCPCPAQCTANPTAPCFNPHCHASNSRAWLPDRRSACCRCHQSTSRYDRRGCLPQATKHTWHAWCCAAAGARAGAAAAHSAWVPCLSFQRASCPATGARHHPWASSPTSPHLPHPHALQRQAEAGPAAAPRQGAAQEGRRQAGGQEEVGVNAINSTATAACFLLGGTEQPATQLCRTQISRRQRFISHCNCPGCGTVPSLCRVCYSIHCLVLLLVCVGHTRSSQEGSRKGYSER